MDKFTCVEDIGDLRQAVAEALEIKRDRFQFTGLGRNKTLLMLFFNSSLRTRLSTQKAAMNLGMNVMVLDVNQGAWKLETERGVVMDGDKAEHLLEAIPVMGSYCDVIGVRSFARFQDKAEDYEERVLEQFIRHSGRPVFSMEAATRHPLQSFADLITIEEHKRTARPKVVMTWAPHPNALPQAVPNSFAEWMNAADYDFVITTGGASNGDYDFIKPVVEELGELHMTLVSMRPGKAQTFGTVNGTPVFGLPGNPAAAYCGFEVLIRQALRKMQGYSSFGRPTVKARLVGSRKKKDPRRIYLRATLQRNAEGELTVTPAKNQSSGLFSTLQRANCLAVLPEGTSSNPIPDGTMLDCLLLDVEEGTVVGR